MKGPRGDLGTRCRLCLRPRTLRRSHIIPEFLYRPLYGRTHRAISLHRGLRYLRRFGTGLREPLLCSECESIFQRYEDYFARRWFQARPLPTLVPVPANLIVASDLDYGPFKLFHLSVLWRASVSTLVEFRDVRLGPHEEHLRHMFLSSDPGPQDKYRIMATLLLRPGTRIPHIGVVTVPQRRRYGSHWIYSAIYAGCAWHVVVSSPPLEGDSLALSTEGVLSMPIVDLREIHDVHETIRRGYAVALRKNQRAE